MINAWLIDNFGQRLMIFQKISSHCHCHSFKVINWLIILKYHGVVVSLYWKVYYTICVKKWVSVPETKLFKCCQNSVDHFSNKLFSSLFSQEKKMGQGHYHLRRICTLHKVSWIWRWKRNFHELHLC